VPDEIPQDEDAARALLNKQRIVDAHRRLHAAANDPRVALRAIDKDTPQPWSAAERELRADAARNSASDALLAEIFERPITDTNRPYLKDNAERLLTAGRRGQDGSGACEIPRPCSAIARNARRRQMRCGS